MIAEHLWIPASYTLVRETLKNVPEIRKLNNSKQSKLISDKVEFGVKYSVGQNMILWMVKAMYHCYKFLCTKQNRSALYKLKKLLEMETSDKTTVKTISRFFSVWSCLITMNKSSMNIQVNIFVDICFYLSWINTE